MTIAAWPVADWRSVVSAFKPGTDPSAESPLRTLKEHHFTSGGVRVTRRVAGHFGGQIRVYSALNIDAARLARHGHAEAAAQAARAAGDLEAGPEFSVFQRLLSELPTEAAQRVVDGVLSDDLPDELVKVLRALALRTEQLRSLALSATTAADIVVGRILEVHASYVILALVKDSGTTMVPRWMAVAAKRDTVGALLALITDKLDPRSAVIEAVPAIAVDDDAVPGAFNPFDRGDSRTIAITVADEHLLARKPAPLRIIVPVTIEE